jgi:hypothetical protein
MTKAWEQALRDNRQSVLDGWSVGASSLLSGGNPSPVADALAVELGRLLDAMAAGDPVDEPLSRFTRILAVQDIPPSKSLSLLFDIVPLCGGLSADALERFRDRVEGLVLQAFDSFMKHRETIYQLKVEEGHRRMHMALRRVEA